MKQICVQLPDEVLEKLDSVAQREQRSRSNLARIVLESWLEHPAHVLRAEGSRILPEQVAA